MKPAPIFSRGQIWWMKADTNEVKNSDNHLMDGKDRYYLVVSCKKNNENAPIANCLVITSRPHDNLPMHVPFVMPSGKPSMVCCEQIFTKSMDKFKSGQYVGCLTDDIMARVSRALANQLELEMAFPGVSELMKLFEKMVDERLRVSNELDAESFVKSVIGKLDEKIKPREVEKVSTEEYVEAVTEWMGDFKNPNPRCIARLEEAKSLEVSSKGALFVGDGVKEEDSKKETLKKEPPKKEETGKVTKKRTKWTDEMKIQFLLDCDKMSPRKVMEKYGIKSVQGVYQYKYKFQNEK